MAELGKKRIFLGTKIEENFIDENLISIFDKNYLRIVKSENRHITWSFFGDLDEGIFFDIEKNIEDKIKNTKTFCLNLNRYEIWPSFINPRVLVICGDDKEKKCSELSFKIDGKGLLHKKNEKFVPHITVARFKRGMKFENPFNPSIVKEFKVFIDRVTLFESKLTHNGSIYSDLKTYFLD